MKDRTLTLKQRAFVKAYLMCRNASEAARQAGYKDKYIDRAAYQIMHRPMIKAEIDKHIVKFEKSIEITFNKKINMLWALAEEAKNDGERDVAIKAIAEINKMHGHYAPDKSYNVNINENREVKEIQEIREMYKKDI